MLAPAMSALGQTFDIVNLAASCSFCLQERTYRDYYFQTSLVPTVVPGTSSIAPTSQAGSRRCSERLCCDSEQRQKHDTARHKKCADCPDDPEALFHDEGAD